MVLNFVFFCKFVPDTRQLSMINCNKSLEGQLQVIAVFLSILQSFEFHRLATEVTTLTFRSTMFIAAMSKLFEILEPTYPP